MHSYIKKSIIICGLICANLLFFQNCSKGGFTQQSSLNEPSSVNISFGSDDTTAKSQFCPLYMPPLCAADETLSTVKSANGCEHPTCVKSKVILCPQYMAVACGKNQVLKSHVDKEGCSYPVCENVGSCPLVQPPLCEGGEIVATKDEDGCPRAICKRKVKPICPAVMAPVCEDGVIVTSVSSDGCQQISCKPNIKPICPQVMPPLCEDGELVPTQSTNGCPGVICKKNVSPTCPVYNAPLCKFGSVIKMRLNKDGCSYPSCEPIKACPQVAAVACIEGELVQTEDENGCMQGVCVVNPNPSCPQYMKPLCAQNSALRIVPDSNDCPVPVCNAISDK